MLIRFFLLFMAFNASAKAQMNSKNNETPHFINVMEEISMDILSDRYLGIIQFDSKDDLEKICLSKLVSQFTPEQINALKERIPGSYVIAFKKDSTILKELIHFNQSVYFPLNQALISHINSQLSLDQQQKIQRIKSDYLKDLHAFYEVEAQKIKQQLGISKEEREKQLNQLELKEKLFSNFPRIEGIWSKENENFNYLLALIPSIQLNSFSDGFDSLRKERFKIKLGNMGNIARLTYEEPLDYDLILALDIIELMLK